MTTLIPGPRLPLDDDHIDVGVCTGCVALAETAELSDCGSHTLCPDCLASSPCSACHAIRSEIAADLADQRSYDAWRDEQAVRDWEDFG